MNKPSAQQIRKWMHRQRTLGTPSRSYLEWLRKQYRLTCVATVITAASISGCASMDQFVCTGTGTCGVNSVYAQNTQSQTTLPQTVFLPNGAVVVVRDTVSGQIQSVIPVSSTK